MISKLISGGQTGADQGGLEAACLLDIPTGGWCPKGWRTEKGECIALKAYGLKETTNYDYGPRTVLNVRESDGTVIFGDTHSSGSRLTIDACTANRKPYLPNPDHGELGEWIAEHAIKILNVAGNRESKRLGIQVKVRNYLLKELVIETQLKLVE